MLHIFRCAGRLKNEKLLSVFSNLVITENVRREREENQTITSFKACFVKFH